MADRIVAVPEEIWLPHAGTTPGRMTLRLPSNVGQDSITRVRNGGRCRDLLKTIQSAWGGSERAEGSILDLRMNSPSNWAHAFTNHLPVALLARSHSGLISGQMSVLLPSGTPRMIVELFERSGFPSLLTDKAVSGQICSFDVRPWIAIRGVRHEVLRSSLYGSELHRSIENNNNWPKQIFIARRGARRVENHLSVQNALEQNGYVTYYAEDFSLIDQASFIYHARNIVAVHGAALGPLIFKALADDVPYNLMELFSPAHVTNVYRVIAHQTGGNWIGVRGRAWPRLLSRHANFSANMENFEIAEESLELGLQRLAGLSST